MTTSDPYADYPDHLHPAKNFTPRQNPPKPLSVAGEVGYIKPNMTDDELRLMAREKLSELLQSIDAAKQPSLLLTVAREVMDRIEGKPTQRIEQRVEHSSRGRVGEMSSNELDAQLRAAKVAGLLPAGVALADDGTLTITDAEYSEIKGGDSLTS